MDRRVLALALPLAALLTGCAQLASKPKPAPPVKIDQDPYPSTYARYPGVATLIRNATILDGEGARIDNGSVLIADGKIVGVHQAEADFPVPTGTTVSTAAASSSRLGSSMSTVTSAIIHRRAPNRIPTAMRRPARRAPKSGPSTASGRRTRASAGRWPTAA